MVNTREIAAEYRLSHWAQVLKERQESGQSIKAYCRQTGIAVNTYHYWQRKLRAHACEALMPRGGDLPAMAAAPKGWAVCETEITDVGRTTAVSIEIGEFRVTATADTDPELLGKVCRVLSGLC
jgi:transposase-like protein